MRRPKQSQFAYDFEQPVREMDDQVADLQERATKGEDVASQLKSLQDQRDRMLREIMSKLTAYQRVKLARHPLRPLSREYIRKIFDDFVELHGDRRFRDDKAIVSGLATLGPRRLLVIAQQKGRESREKLEVNFGMPNPEGYRKALHKMGLAEKFGLPVVCLIDTPGAAPAVEAEERGQGMAIAENIWRMSGLRTPIVIIVTGEGCSGGALGIGVGDRFAMLENAYYSVISPEGCAAILWRSSEMADQAAEAMKLTAQDMLSAGVIDEIIPEPLGGAHRDLDAASQNVKAYLTRVLDELAAVPLDKLLEQRYQRYRKLGPVATAPSGQ